MRATSNGAHGIQKKQAFWTTTTTTRINVSTLAAFEMWSGGKEGRCKIQKKLIKMERGSNGSDHFQCEIDIFR